MLISGNVNVANPKPKPEYCDLISMNSGLISGGLDVVQPGKAFVNTIQVKSTGCFIEAAS